MSDTITYNVYFSQVNQSMVEVKAKDTDEAIAKAIRIWKREDGVPHIVHIDGGAK